MFLDVSFCASKAAVILGEVRSGISLRDAWVLGFCAKSPGMLKIVMGALKSRQIPPCFALADAAPTVPTSGPDEEEEKERFAAARAVALPKIELSAAAALTSACHRWTSWRRCRQESVPS